VLEASAEGTRVAEDLSNRLGASFWSGPFRPCRPSQGLECGGVTRFVNAVEEQCARLLDFHGIRWEYEPRTFDLEIDDQGRVRDAFTPDFYLPEMDLYIEVTTMRQALATRKNRKVRLLEERYPDVRVKLFTRRDIDRLVENHGLQAGAA
jgi:hypothetical protein